jgi:hypothetical protein
MSRSVGHVGLVGLVVGVVFVMTMTVPYVLAQYGLYGVSVDAMTGSIYTCSGYNLYRIKPNFQLDETWTLPIRGCNGLANDRQNSNVIYYQQNFEKVYRVDLKTSNVTVIKFDQQLDSLLRMSVDMNNRLAVVSTNIVYMFTTDGQSIAVTQRRDMIIVDQLKNAFIQVDSGGKQIAFWNHTTPPMNVSDPRSNRTTFVAQAYAATAQTGNVIVCDTLNERLVSIPPLQSANVHISTA